MVYNNDDLNPIRLDPKRLYKMYAKQCDLKDWLKIYKSNKIYAMFMHEWLPNEIFIDTLSLKLTVLDTWREERNLNSSRKI